MAQKRRHFGNAVKALVVRRYLARKEPVSKLAEEYGSHHSQIHSWGHLVLGLRLLLSDMGADEKL